MILWRLSFEDHMYDCHIVNLAATLQTSLYTQLRQQYGRQRRPAYDWLVHTDKDDCKDHMLEHADVGPDYKTFNTQASATLLHHFAVHDVRNYVPDTKH